MCTPWACTESAWPSGMPCVEQVRGRCVLKSSLLVGSILSVSRLCEYMLLGVKCRGGWQITCILWFHKARAGSGRPGHAQMFMEALWVPLRRQTCTTCRPSLGSVLAKGQVGSAAQGGTRALGLQLSVLITGSWGSLVHEHQRSCVHTRPLNHHGVSQGHIELSGGSPPWQFSF